MSTVLSHVCDSVRQLIPYQPGRPIADVAKEKGIEHLIKLASNENPLGPSPQTMLAIQTSDFKQMGRYPDSNATSLKQQLAQHLSCSCDCLILGNGSNDILELASQLLLTNNTTATYSQHAFIVYELATKTRRATPQIVAAKNYAHDLKALAVTANTSDSRVLFIANPNNPTGTWHPPEAILQCLQTVKKDTLVIVDEAYVEYLPNPEKSALPFLANFDNLLITRTFSKIYGLAGLRIGYGIGHPSIIDLLNRVRQPFNLGAISQIAATAALADDKHLQTSRDLNNQGYHILKQAFDKMGIDFIPSYANFISFRPPNNADNLFNYLLENGIIVRSLKEYQMPDWLRVSIGTVAENKRFLKCLQSYR